jgi:diadenosine tetraphosphate (Ap4A) HIT family hydrolase
MANDRDTENNINSKCIICDFVTLSPDRIFETKFWVVNLRSDDQAFLGRSTVLLKTHKGDLSELDENEWADFHRIIKRFEKALRSSFKPALFNWSCLMNDAYKDSPPNPHVHWHVRPRYEKSVEFSGQTFYDKDFGHNYYKTAFKLVSQEVATKIVEKIKEYL